MKLIREKLFQTSQISFFDLTTYLVWWI